MINYTGWPLTSRMGGQPVIVQIPGFYYPFTYVENIDNKNLSDGKSEVLIRFTKVDLATHHRDHTKWSCYKRAV